MSRVSAFASRNMDYVVLLVLNAAEMVLELVAARLMSPYFGNSNFVWTAIIGIILLAASLGNIIGGKLASFKNARLMASVLLLIAAIYLAVTPLVGAPILESIKASDSGVQMEAVIGSIVFFLIPETIMGVTTPIIMKDKIGDSKDKGKESGRITALIAIGSLVGTFAGGFWLIPALGTKMIFVLLAIVVIACALLFKPIQGVKKVVQKWWLWLAALLAVVITVVALNVVNAENGEADLKEGVSIDTEYGRIIVEDTMRDSDEVRLYKQSGAYESATFLDEDKKYDLVYDYVKKYDEMFKFLDVKEVAMIGGAAYQYPKYFIAHFEDKKMDVIEIDPMSTEIARKYFFLDDLIRDYGEDRLGLYNEDGRVFMDGTEKKYDAILNDAFSGEVPVSTLTTVEAAKTIKKALSHDGVYMSNVLGAVDGRQGKFLRSEVKTLQKVFEHVYVLPVHQNAKRDAFLNWMVVATDSDNYQPKDALKVELKDSDLVLTDDYNPIDSLISTDYFEQ